MIQNWPKRKRRTSEVTFAVFESATTYLSNHSKAEAIPLSAMPKDTTSELADIFTLFLFNAERHAGKL